MMERTIPDPGEVPDSNSKYRPARKRNTYNGPAKVPFFSIIPVLMIERYQKKTVDRPHQCNFIPTCSEYARLAYILYGPVVGTLMTRERIKHCNDFHSDWPRYNKP